MSFFSELSEGFAGYSRAHKVIFKYRLTRYFLLPGIITVVFAAIYVFLFGYLGTLFEVDPESLPSWISWAGSALNWVIRSLFWVTMIWLFFAGNKYIVLTILASYLGSLSEAIEALETGRKPEPIGFKGYVKDIIRALRLSIRNMIREILLCFAAGFIPLVGPIVILGISAYYYGFGYVDYVLERKRFNIRQSVAFMRKRTGLAVGLGIPTMLLMLVPIVGWMIAPVYATAAATLETMDELEELRQASRQPFNGA